MISTPTSPNCHAADRRGRHHRRAAHQSLCRAGDQRQRRKRRFSRKLEHHGATRRESRGKFAGHHGRGEVPRRDARDDTHRRLEDNNALVAVVAGNDIAVNALGRCPESFKIARAAGDFALGPGPCLPHSAVRIVARSSVLATTRSYQRRRIAARSFPVASAYSLGATSAATMARRISGSAISATSASSSPVEGLQISIRAAASTHSPASRAVFAPVTGPPKGWSKRLQSSRSLSDLVSDQWHGHGRQPSQLRAGSLRSRLVLYNP